jgi:integrase
MKCQLTAKEVAKLELPTGKADVLIWDAEVQGLAVRVRRAADNTLQRTWVCQRKRHGKIIRVRLGRVSEIGIDAARKAARKVLGQIDLGGNPAAERRAAAAKQARTMSALVVEYLEGKRHKVRASTLSEITRYLQGPYFKSLHNIPIHEIDRGRVSRCVEAIERERGAPTSREARQCLSGFFSWAMQMAEAPANPVIGSYRPEGITARDHVLTDAELAAVWRACGDDDTGRVIRLLILCGCRRSEIGGLRWSWFAPDMSTFTIPKEHSKNGKEHCLPVLATMRSILGTVPRVVGRDQLFGIRHAQGFSLWAEGKKALDKKLGDSVRPWKLHDIRRSVATGMAKLGVLPHVIECVLNHQSGFRSGVGGVYNRNPYEREVRAALALWEDHLAALVAGTKRKIVPFKTA